MPRVDVQALTHQHLLRSLDALMDHQEAVDDVVANLLRPLVDPGLSLVFDGNQAEAPTLLPTLKKVLTRFGYIKRLIVLADRGLLSLGNIDELGKIKLPQRTVSGIHSGGAGPALR